MNEKLLPIVAGCRAITINFSNPAYMSCIGEEVTVIGRSVKYPNRWLIEGHKSLQVAKARGFKIPAALEKNLLRIDGGSFEHEKDEQLEKVK